MRRIVKWALGAVGSLLGVAGLGIGYVTLAFPKVGSAPDLRVEKTPDVVERGAYIAHHLAACLDCHSTSDWTRYSGPLVSGTEGKGGEHYTREKGFPGDFYAPNITPASLGSWSDGEIARAVTTGVTKDGRAMFPVMPYRFYRHLCDRDVKAIVAFVRTLTPILSDVPAGQLDFPMNLIVRTIPEPPDPWPCPSPATPEYGRYVTTIAACKECHTLQNKGQPLPGMDFAGGWVFPLPNGGHVASANITPDLETGIGNWKKEEFIARFKAFAIPGAATPVNKGAANTIMPWTMYAGMTPEDLGAIYDHLRAQKPVSNTVERFRP